MVDSVSKHRFTRRGILGSALAIGASMVALPLLQACGQPAASPTTAPAAPAGATPVAGQTSGSLGIKGAKLGMIAGKGFVPAQDEYRDKVVKEWCQANGVEITYDPSSENMTDAQLTTIIETGQGPELLTLSTETPYVFAKGLAPVDDIVDELGKAYGGFYDCAKASAFVGGKWLGVPMFINPNAWNYREDFFKEAGVDKFPTTYDEFLAAAKKLNDKGHPVGVSYGHASNDASIWHYPLLWAFGAREVEEDGKTLALDSKETVDAINYSTEIYKYMVPGVASWTEVGNNQAFLGDACSATLNVNTIYLAAKRDNTAIAGKMNHGPHLAGPKGQFAYHTLGHYGIFKHTKYLDAAKAWVRHWFSQEIYTGWLKAGQAYTVPLLKAYENVSWTPDDPKLQIFKNMGMTNRLPGYAAPSGGAPAEAKAKFLIVDMFAKAAQGMSAKDAIAWAVSEYKPLIK